MKNIIVLLACVVGGCSLQSVYVKDSISRSMPSVPDDSIFCSIFLIGDAGAPVENGEETILNELTKATWSHPEKNTILFLGDNIYPAGLPDTNDNDRREMERRLQEQMSVGEKSGARTIFIPGNHDWARHGKNGLATLRRQQDFITKKGTSNVSMIPLFGMPGPVVVDIDSSVRIIVIDTEWWLHEYEKPLYPGTPSEDKTKTAFLDSLTRVLTTGRTTIVAAHHPLESHGEHGGFFDWRDHLFPLRHISPFLWVPLPGIGSLYPLSRMWGISNQDFSGSKYREMRISIDSVLSIHPPIIYAAGHEHTLQILEPKTGYYHLISGFGMKNHISPLTTGENTIFARLAPGFMRIDFVKSGFVRLAVFEVKENPNNIEEIFSMPLR